MPSAPERQTNALLGYPADARLLIINADDFGMCHAVTEATVQLLHQGIVSSTTLMVPCPWAPHAMQLLTEHPEISFGVHLTLISDFSNYRWGPLTSKHNVPSLLDESGYFYGGDRIPELLARAELGEVEREFRAQIEAVLATQLTPTHLDWHCLADGGRADISELTLGLAKEYGLALRVHGRSFAQEIQRMDLPTSDHEVLDSYHLNVVDKSARYAQLLRALPAGLTEWAVHPSLGTPEAQALAADNWQTRRADYDFFISHEARDILDEEGIVLLDYRALQKLWAN